MSVRIAEAFEQIEERYPAIERSRNSLLLWLIPLMFAQVGAIAALVKLL